MCPWEWERLISVCGDGSEWMWEASSTEKNYKTLDEYFKRNFIPR